MKYNLPRIFGIVSCLFLPIQSWAATRMMLQTQPSTSAVAGIPFTQQPVIRIEDEFGNLLSSDNSTVVTADINTGIGTLQGTVTATAVNGVVTFTDLSCNVAQEITLGFFSAGLTNIISVPILVQPNTPTRLGIQTSPSSTNVAGVVFAQQPVVRVEDAYGNLIPSDNSTVITANRGQGTGTLSGSLAAVVTNGVARFNDLSYTVAETITLNFSAGGFTSVESSGIVVLPAAAVKLGFSTQPGNGRADAPFAQPVVESQDQFGNHSTVGLPDNLVATVTLSSGSGTLLGTTSLDIGKLVGNGTASFSDLQINDAGLNKQLTASADSLASAVSSGFMIGGVSVAPSVVLPSNGSFVTLNGPNYYELASGDVNVGTIILNAPSGYEFDTGGTAPTVLIRRIAGSGSGGRNINSAKNGSGSVMPVSSRSATQIGFDITATSGGGAICSLTWQNVRVRILANAPALGEITKTGTAALAAVQDQSTSFGTLLSPVPRPARLVVQTQPQASAIAGNFLNPQPVVRVEDQFGSLWTGSSVSVTAVRAAGGGTLQGTTTINSANGTVAFNDLSHTAATNITIRFSSPGLIGATSSIVNVAPATADHLVFSRQPVGDLVGLPFAVQPIVRTQDRFGNFSVRGLAPNIVVTSVLAVGTGNLSGGTTVDIGAAAGNGTASFSTLTIDAAGDKQLSISASAFVGATSALFTINKASQTITFGNLANKTFGDAPFIVSATASSGLPVSFSILSGPATISGNTITITAAGVVTVRATQNGDANYLAASPVDRGFLVSKVPQTITFPAINGKTFGDAPFTLNATASSGLPVSYNIVSGPATLSGNTVTITGAGSVTVRASQAGNTTYLAATNADQTFTVAKANQTITFPTIPTKAFGDAPFALSASASSGLPVTFNVLSGPATISGNILTITGIGSVTVRASQAGNPNVNPATSVSQTFTVTRASQTISFATLPNKTYSDDPFTFQVRSSSGLPPTLRVVSGPVFLSTTVIPGSPTVIGTVLILGTGTVTIRASQAGNANYLPAPDVDRTFVISPAALIATANDAARVVGGPNPVFTGSITGLKAGEQITANYTTTATTNSPEGSYDIDISLVDPFSLLSNYTVTLRKGTLTIVSAPVIAAQPADQTVSDGGTATFNVTATGTPPLSYQWRFNGNAIAGSTDAALTIANVKASDAGNYDVIVSNAGASVTSTVATLTLLTADLALDASPDVLLQNTNGSTAIWFLNNTNFISSAPLRTTAPAWHLISQSDFNNDGRKDFFWQNDDGNIAVWFMNGTNFLGSVLLKRPGVGWKAVGTADIDRDTRDDIVWQHTNGTTAVWFMNGTNVAGSSLFRDGQAVAAGWNVVALGDFNSDGKIDFLFQNIDGRLAVWFLNGIQFLGAGTVLRPDSGWQVSGAADFNQDGRKDLLFQLPTGAGAMWLMDGTNFLSSVVLRNGQSAGPGWRIVGPK